MRKQFSVKVGSIFEDSPLGLDKWLPCVWLISNCKNGVSSYEIARDLKVTQKTAWFMLHRVREAMQRQNHHQIVRHWSGLMIVYRGKARNMHRIGASALSPALVAKTKLLRSVLLSVAEGSHVCH